MNESPADRQKASESRVLQHFHAYPLMEITDLLKYLHHSSFGCEHMVSSLERATNYIQEEAARMQPLGDPFVEPLDGDFCRVHLSCLTPGLSAQTLGKLFYLSARCSVCDQSSLYQKLDVCRKLISEGQLPFSLDEFNATVEWWSSKNFGALHHSDAFRAAYRPAYRVISNRFALLLPLFCRIDQQLLAHDHVYFSMCEMSDDVQKEIKSVIAEVYESSQVLHTDEQSQADFSIGGTLQALVFHQAC